MSWNMRPIEQMVVGDQKNTPGLKKLIWTKLLYYLFLLNIFLTKYGLFCPYFPNKAQMVSSAEILFKSDVEQGLVSYFPNKRCLMVLKYCLKSDVD